MGGEHEEVAEEAELRGRSAWQVPRNRAGPNAQKRVFQGTERKDREQETKINQRGPEDKHGEAAGDEAPQNRAEGRPLRRGAIWGLLGGSVG